MDMIETPRLVLRNFSVGDAADLLAYLKEPAVSCFLSLQLDDLEQAEAEARKRQDSDEYIAVCLRDTGQLIGDLFAMREDDTFSVGWNFNPAFGGHGYASEAARALFAFLFTTANARRLYAYVEDDNVPSQRLCERLGMRRKGFFSNSSRSERTEMACPCTRTRCNTPCCEASGSQCGSPRPGSA